jgi:hypothetical protein
LEQAPRYETFVRTYAYPTGAAYGVLLDALASGWTRRLRGTESFGELLASVAVRRPAVDAAETARRYGGVNLLASERVREQERAARVADYVRRFVEEPVLILPRTRQSSSATSGLTPLGEHGTIVRQFSTTAPWGRFEADAVLRAADYSAYAVPAPRDTRGRVLTGPGWRLELAEGWVVAPGPRRGDFRVVPGPKVPVVAALRRMVDARQGLEHALACAPLHDVLNREGWSAPVPDLRTPVGKRSDRSPGRADPAALPPERSKTSSWSNQFRGRSRGWR